MCMQFFPDQLHRCRRNLFDHQVKVNVATGKRALHSRKKKTLLNLLAPSIACNNLYEHELRNSKRMSSWHRVALFATNNQSLTLCRSFIPPSGPLKYKLVKDYRSKTEEETTVVITTGHLKS